MDDPLSGLQLDDNFYPWIACHLQKLTSKMVLILEGGYSKKAMARSNLKMIKVLKNKSTNEEKWEVKSELEVKNETKILFRQIQDNHSPFFTI